MQDLQPKQKISLTPYVALFFLQWDFNSWTTPYSTTTWLRLPVVWMRRDITGLTWNSVPACLNTLVQASPAWAIRFQEIAVSWTCCRRNWGEWEPWQMLQPLLSLGSCQALVVKFLSWLCYSTGRHCTGIACILWKNEILRENLTMSFFPSRKGQRFLIEEKMHKKQSLAHLEEDTSLVQKE